MPLSAQSIWSFERAQRHWTALGASQILDQQLTAFFASRKSPGAAIRAAMDWALEQASQRNPVISGFHSPLEQSVLAILLQARSPVVVMMARPVAEATVRAEWKAALATNACVLVSAKTASAPLRLTTALALQRNEAVAQLADSLVVAHASVGGELAGQCRLWEQRGLMIRYLSEAA